MLKLFALFDILFHCLQNLHSSVIAQDSGEKCKDLIKIFVISLKMNVYEYIVLCMHCINLYTVKPVPETTF